MSESPARQKVNELFPELLDGLRLLEGRFPANEIANRVVRAAMGQPGVVGARLWRADRGEAEVWAEAGTLPESAATGIKPGLPSDTSKDPTIWAGALGSDDFRVRVLEVRGAGPLEDRVRSQMDLLARFSAVVLALAERRGAMKELSSIIEATKKLNSTLDLGELIHIILQIASRQTGAERGTVFLVDQQRNEIWSLVGIGLEQQVIRLPAERGIAGWVAREGSAVRLENAYDDPRFEPDIDRKLGFKTKQLMCLPIRNEAGAIIGVLQLLNKTEGFTDEDEAFLDALSAHVALALEKAQLHRERVEKEKMERDLALAREIQAGLLPEAPPAFPGIEIAVSHRASQMVGGDYYDFLPVQVEGGGSVAAGCGGCRGQGRGFGAGDGQRAGDFARAGGSRRDARKIAGYHQSQNFDGRAARSAQGRAHDKYLSMFLALVESGGRKLRYVNAGHVPPAVVRADGRVEWLEAGGMIVGLLPDVQFESGTVALGAGRSPGGVHGRNHGSDGFVGHGIQPAADGGTGCASARARSPEEIMRARACGSGDAFAQRNV